MTPEASGRIIRLIISRSRHPDTRVAQVLLQVEIEKALSQAIKARDKEWRAFTWDLVPTDEVIQAGYDALCSGVGPSLTEDAPAALTRCFKEMLVAAIKAAGGAPD